MLRALSPLKQGLIAAITEIDRAMLQQAWTEIDYWLGICHRQAVHLQGTKKKIERVLFPSVGWMLKSFLPFKCTNFMKCVTEL